MRVKKIFRKTGLVESTIRTILLTYGLRAQKNCQKTYANYVKLSEKDNMGQKSWKSPDFLKTVIFLAETIGML